MGPTVAALAFQESVIGWMRAAPSRAERGSEPVALRAAAEVDCHHHFHRRL